MKPYRKISVLLFLTALFFYAAGQQPSLHKTFLTVEEGLSHDEVTAIVQDHEGFIWIGTRGGLNRYDGYGFKIFNQEPGDTNSLANPSIESLFVDRQGNLWIGTKSGGASQYNPKTGQFRNFKYNYHGKSKASLDYRILSFYEDNHGRIWMGTWENGIIIYDTKRDSASYHLGNRMVNSIIGIPGGSIWVGTEDGLFEYIEDSGTFELRNPEPDFYTCQELKYDPHRNVIWITPGFVGGLVKFDPVRHTSTHYRIEEDLPYQKGLQHSYYSAYIDNKGKIWIGTWGTGSYLFDPEKETFERYLIYPENYPTYNKDYDTVLDIFQDRDNNIWLGTNGGGVCLLTPRLGFNTVGYHPEPHKGLTNTRIMSVVDDKNGNLWLGTIGSGLYWSPDRENFYPVNNPYSEINSRFFVIKYLYQDSAGNIWVGSNRGTFVVEFLNGKPGLVNPFSKMANPPFRQNLQFVSILDAWGMLWFGSLENGLFLVNKDHNYSQLKHLTKGDKASGELSNNRISYLLKDSKNNVWVGTYNGLHVIHPADTTIHRVEDLLNVIGSFTGNIITCLDEDLSGNLWIGTPNGLNLLKQVRNNEFEIAWFTEKEGLASNFIKGISHDAQGNLWISTNLGISKYNIEKHSFFNYNEEDGILGKNFTEASVYRNGKGDIFFGGTQGLTWFKPEDIAESFSANQPVLTGLKIFNQPVEVGQKFGPKTILQQTITHTGDLVIPYRFNNFEIEFSALDYKAKGKNNYAYMLENHDKSWNYTGTRRFVNFNNLRQGDYILKIKSSDSHNLWNDVPVEIAIKILPPFWQTWYALVFYILLITAIVLLIRWNAVKQIRLANNLEKEKLLHEQDQRISELKFQFFTNISHEFRTPLSLMAAPLKELLNNASKFKLADEVSHKIQIIYLNTDRLLKLVNQLLDFRKAETGNMKLTARYSDIEAFVHEVCLSFHELARINQISFMVNSSIRTKYIWFDREKLEMILNNLISNAFKKVSEGGKIEVTVFEEEEEILLSVSDNGPGIKPAEINHIFDRFYRVEKTDNYGSSGIGLALTKRLVELQRGSITVSSEPNQHTEFIVTLPKGNDHLTEEEMITSPEIFQRTASGNTFFPGPFSAKQKTKPKSGKRILVVDDNRDITGYLEGLLGNYYEVETAFDGSEGFRKAAELKPDLIISDVMMPETDGFEFCKKVKSHLDLSTIPFILLTAKNEEQHKILGARTGADDFISKPFDPDYLLQKIESLLLNKEVMKKQFSKSIRLEPSAIEITNAEQVFIEKIIKVIEKNLQNPDFSSEVLAREMNMSNSTLYRKLKELTGSSIADFIRTIRIKRAAQLLADKEKTVTEIAFEVGFNDVKHFRTVFQKQFGCAPTEYRNKS